MILAKADKRWACCICRSFQQRSIVIPPLPKDEDEQGPRTPATRPQRTKGVNTAPLPPKLNRPIGVAHLGLSDRDAEREVLRHMTFRERTLYKLDKDRLQKERNRIMSEFRTSYWRDFQDMNQWQGKQWIANERLFKREKALLMPNFQGRTAAGHEASTVELIRKAPCTIATIGNVRSAETHIEMFLSQIKAKYGNGAEAMRHGLQYVQINIQDNPLKAWLVKAFMGSLARSMPPEQRDKYFLVTHPPDKETLDAIAMINHIVGYVYLLDSQSHIRWAACAEPMGNEAESLVNGVERILAESQQAEPK